MATASSQIMNTKLGADGEGPSTSQAGQKKNVPESECPICLQDKKFEAFLETCKHSFCFACIYNWSSTKLECPLCQGPLKDILHEVEGNGEPCRHPPKPKYKATDLSNKIEESLAKKRAAKNSCPPSLYVSNRRRVYLEDLFAIETYPGIDVTPNYFVENDGEFERVLIWVDRELRAIFLHREQEYISASYGYIAFALMKDHLMSKTFRSCIRFYFGKLSRHFQHELACFAASKLSIEEYSKVVTYKSIPMNRGKYKNDRNLDAIDIFIPDYDEDILSMPDHEEILFSDSEDGTSDTESDPEEELGNYMPFKEDNSKLDPIDNLIPVHTRRFHYFAQRVPNFLTFAQHSVPSDFDCLVKNPEYGLRIMIAKI